MTSLNDLDHIEGLLWLEDDEVLTQRGPWWCLDTDDSAIGRLHAQPIRHALIGKGQASCEEVEIQLLLSEVVGGPFVLAVATDADSGNYVEVATTNDHEQLARLFGEVLASWLFCGHDYELSGTGAMVLPG